MKHEHTFLMCYATLFEFMIFFKSCASSCIQLIGKKDLANISHKGKEIRF